MNKICLLFLVWLYSSSVFGQYSIDKQYLNNIRWTPIPVKTLEINQNKLDLTGKWLFNESPEKSFWNKKTKNNWREINVPGEWSMQGFEVERNQFTGYKKNFEIPDEWKNCRIKLKCESVYSECRIWVNKQEIGQHLGGFTPFEFDITDAIHKGNNQLSIAVRNESSADTISSASSYAVHPLGGITRSIYLIALPKVNVASLQVQTEFDEKYEDAVLCIETKVANESEKERKIILNYKLTDLDEREILLEENEQKTINVKKGTNVIKTNLKVKNPKKWDPEHPNLYLLNCTIEEEGKISSVIQRRFGFRKIEIRGNQVFVNNRSVKLRGVNHHEVHPLLGRSLTGNIWYEDIKLFKEGNVNFIRTSHYPPSRKLIEACDELGMFVEVEGPFCWASSNIVNQSNYFDVIVRPIAEMIEMNRSHPSVLIWSVANESGEFDKLFKPVSDLIKEIDPTRPRLFCFKDNNYLEIQTNHYPGSDGPENFKKVKRPVLFGEYCHLNCYNRVEQYTDPGLRDFWGDILFNMWEKMYKAKGILGGCIWAGIDDTFFLPSKHVVGYGAWGIVDGWRRPKPEYWHMKKVYSPVKISLQKGKHTDSVKIKLENRYLFSNLNECKIVWHNKGKNGILDVDVEPGKIKYYTFPFAYDELEKLIVDVFKNNEEKIVDQYVFYGNISDCKINSKNNLFKDFIWKYENDKQIAESENIKIEFSAKTLSVYNKNGHKILSEWPELMLLPGNSQGGGRKMTRNINIDSIKFFSPTATNRKIHTIELIKEKHYFILKLVDEYDEAVGFIQMKFNADGTINIHYKYSLLKNGDYRQCGLVFSLPEKFDQLEWKRKGLWSAYPHDHIGRLSGSAQLFYNHNLSNIVGPSIKPTWGYNQDQTLYGSNDFRSTKRNVFNASLLNTTNNSKIALSSDGSQHIRCWKDHDQIKWMIGVYDNLGFEEFLRVQSNHAKMYDQTFIRGQIIQDNINFQVFN